jgi:hypothetical protein
MTGLRRSHFARPVAPVEVPGRCTGLRNRAARPLEVSSPYRQGCTRRFRHQPASGENAEGTVVRGAQSLVRCRVAPREAVCGTDPEFVKTFGRCHATLRGLMSSCAPISGCVRPSRASREICASMGLPGRAEAQGGCQLQDSATGSVRGVNSFRARVPARGGGGSSPRLRHHTPPSASSPTQYQGAIELRPGLAYPHRGRHGRTGCEGR